MTPPTFPISPKVIYQTAVVLVACIALALITGDKSYLVGVLLALAGGGAGVLAPAAKGRHGTANVTQAEVRALAVVPKPRRGQG